MTTTIKLVALAAAVLAPVGAFLLGDHRGYERGEAETAQRLHNATIEAAGDLTNAAEARRLVRRQCLAAGGVPILATGECEFGPTGSNDP